MELILVNERNFIDALYNNNPFNNNSFMPSLQLFLGLVNEKYYRKDDDILNTIPEILSNETMRIYKSHDLKGVEVGGGLKNIIAFCAGAWYTVLVCG